MSGKRIIFYILGPLIAGTIILGYMELNSMRHVNDLISANNLLLDEYKITQNLLDAGRGKVVIERNIRGFIESGDTAYLSGLEGYFSEIRNAQNVLRRMADDSVSLAMIAEFNGAIDKKLNLFNNVLLASRLHGIRAAEDTINANLPEWVSFAIENNVRRITDERNRRLAAITGNVQQSGQKALQFNYIVMALILAAAVLTFVYITTIIRRLIRSEKMLRETARVKENFLANMSHEIRTPMNAIVGFTQLLSQEQLNEKSRYYVKAIESSGENLLAIVNDILDISKIEAGMMRIEHVPFSLRGLINSIETMVEPRAREKGLLLFTTVEKDTPDILEGDPVRLTQILNNLLGNALKFTSEGTVSLKVSVKEQQQNEVTIGIVVSDTGIGIEPEKLSRVFGRFEQADDTITREYGGTGLGLSIVRDLVMLQGGSIDVESSPGMGTSFYVVLPYKISTGSISNENSIPEQKLIKSHTELAILAAEDNDVNQSLLQHLFARWGLPLELVNNGSEAIEKLKANRYDLVLMDIQMPVTDGYTAARKIRNELKSDVPIIAMTAHAMPGERDKCFSYGMNDYIAKPLKQEQLRQLIGRYIDFVQGDPQNETETQREQYQYEYINLDYLKLVSGGDNSYEKQATGKFLAITPSAVDALVNSIRRGDDERVRAHAHNLRSTISVMGLNEKLFPLLDELEYGKVDHQKWKELSEEIREVCSKALDEAKLFLLSLD